MLRLAQHRFAQILAILFCAQLGAAASGLEMTKIIDSGPASNRVNVVFLGDGYTADEIETTYQDHVQRVLQHWFDGEQDPFPRYVNFFNVFRIDVISNESGADDAQTGVDRDTALGAVFGSEGRPERALTIDDVSVNQVVFEAIKSDPFFIDARMVTVNTSRFGGSGGGLYTVFAGGSDSAGELALHELAHSFSGLADEYTTSDVMYDGPEPREANVTKSPGGDKWSHWIGYDQPGIGEIGVYEGARYFGRGLYRPSSDSKMRTLGQPFDAVSREKIILDVYGKVDPLDAWSDDSQPLYNPESVWVDVIDPNVIDVEWWVDGSQLPNQSGEVLDLANLMIGSQRTLEITAIAKDATEWVRMEQDKLRQSVSWSMTLNPGDLNNDRVIDVDDIDLLTREIAEHSNSQRYDLNGNGLVDGLDRTAWVVDMANTYFGDANLDGEFDSSDLVSVFIAAEYEDALAGNSTWATGDWNGDFEFGSSDLLIAFQDGGFEMGPRAPTVGVPEPATEFLAALAVLIFLLVARSKARRCDASFRSASPRLTQQGRLTT